MTTPAYLDYTNGHLHEDLDEPIDMTRLLAGKPVWRWTFDAVMAAKGVGPVHVMTDNRAIRNEVESRGATALHPGKDSMPCAKPLLQVSAGAVLLSPPDIEGFLGHVDDEESVFESSASVSGLVPALLVESSGAIDEPVVIHLRDRIEAARLLFNDWDILETMVRRHGYRAGSRKPVRLLVSDVDGVMTDAGFYYDREGQSLKKFSTRDGMGIVLVRDRIEFGIITGEASGFAETRFGNLKINRIRTGTLDKLPVLDAWRREMGLEWEEVAYVGDDLPDIPCMRVVGIAACPSDAEPEVKAVADYISSRRGGHGAVRDFINHLLSHDLVPPGISALPENAAT